MKGYNAPTARASNKNLSIPGVPAKLVKRLEREAMQESLSMAALIRRILLKHSGLLNGAHTPKG